VTQSARASTGCADARDEESATESERSAAAVRIACFIVSETAMV
jgi:hypothetical protein